MARYKVTTESGSYVVTTEDAPAPAAPSFGGAPKADAAMLPVPGMIPGMAAPRLPDNFSVDAGASRTPNVPAEMTPGGHTPEILRNAGREIKDMVMGIPMAAAAGFPGSPLMHQMNNPQMVQDVLNQTGHDIKQEFTHPGQAFKERPIGTVTDALALATLPELGLKAAETIGAPLAKFGMSAALGPSMKDISTRLARTAEVKAALPAEDLATRFADTMTQFSKEVSDASSKAIETLSPSKYLMDGAKAKDQLLGAIRNAKSEIGRATSNAAVSSKKQLTVYANRLNGLRNTVSEREIGQIIRDMDQDIDWSKPELKASNEAIKGVRTRIDKLLKAGNEDYKIQMQDVEAKTRALKNAEKQFGLKYERGQGYVAPDSAVNKIAGTADSKKIKSRAVLNRVKEHTGQDFIRKAENTRAAEAFSGDGKRGFIGNVLRLGLGGAAGGYMGGPVGFGVGTAAAEGANMFGPKIAGGMIDAYSSARPAIQQLLELANTASQPGRRTIPMTAIQRLVQAGGY